MWKYIIKRILWMAFILVGTAIVVFTTMYFIPTDVSQVILGPSASPAELEALREHLGLNDPYIVQLTRYLINIFIKFDFGNSYISNTPIIGQLAERLPRTFSLGIPVLILSALLGIPLGIIAGLNQKKWQDSLSMFLALLFVSIPAFWLALELVNIFAVKLGWLPVFGIGGVKYYILPVFSASMMGTAMNARQMRSSMLEVIHAEYIVSARSKGVPKSKVIFKHMLPNALIPVITGLGVGLGRSIAGSVVIETVFTIPGIGMYLLGGIKNADYPVVQSSIVIMAFYTASVYLLLDLVYAFIDPRIKAQYSGEMGGVKK